MVYYDLLVNQVKNSINLKTLYVVDKLLIEI